MNEQIREGSSEHHRPAENQKEFFNRYSAELKRATEAEKIANQQARDRLKTLSAPELRKIGAKQALWGWGLSALNWIGGTIGVIGGGAAGFGLGSLATASTGALAVTLGIAAVATPFVAGIGGVVAGAELAGVIYEKFARKQDTSLPPLDKTDKILGGVLAPAGWTPPMIAGARNIFDGYNQIKVIQ